MWSTQELDAEWLAHAPGAADGDRPEWPSEPPGPCGVGGEFAAGGLLDGLVPGPVLAGFSENAWADGLGTLSDDALVGVLRAWRRLASWAAGGETAAVTELDRRRRAEVAAGADPHLAEHVGDELAASLTLTTRAADALLDFACGLARLPLTRAALATGRIDRAKALVITEGASGLTDAHAAAVEAAVIGRAPGQTSGQLRAATQRAVLAADPAAAERRREEARKDARVEVWNERSGTAALAGRDLPPADVLAADKRIDALARQLKSAGREPLAGRFVPNDIGFSAAALPAVLREPVVLDAAAIAAATIGSSFFSPPFSVLTTPIALPSSASVIAVIVPQPGALSTVWVLAYSRICSNSVVRSGAITVTFSVACAVIVFLLDAMVS
jgi:hypothetical protein